MYAHRDSGITYGGGGLASRAPLEASVNTAFNLDDGAPAELEGTADATYDLFELIGILITKGHGAIHHSTHNVNATVVCSMQVEGFASIRCGDLIIYGRHVDAGLGTPPTRPTLVGSDSLAHTQVINRLASANRSKPFMKQYVVQMQRVHDELITVGKIDDANMPSDFLTKWISGRKLRKSIRYATNSDAFVPRVLD